MISIPALWDNALRSGVWYAGMLAIVPDLRVPALLTQLHIPALAFRKASARAGMAPGLARVFHSALLRLFEDSRLNKVPGKELGKRIRLLEHVDQQFEPTHLGSLKLQSRVSPSTNSQCTYNDQNTRIMQARKVSRVHSGLGDRRHTKGDSVTGDTQRERERERETHKRRLSGRPMNVDLVSKKISMSHTGDSRNFSCNFFSEKFFSNTLSVSALSFNETVFLLLIVQCCCLFLKFRPRTHLLHTLKDGAAACCAGRHVTVLILQSQRSCLPLKRVAV